MHALLVTYQRDFFEEEAWYLREVESEFIGHELALAIKVLKKIAYLALSFVRVLLFEVQT
jgi:hypothetical protein